jgi:hypothetical protein
VPNYYDDIIEYESSIPWKAHFKWDEEGSYSQWELEREPDEETDFMLKLNIGFYPGYVIETDLEEHFQEVKRPVYEVR